MARERVNVISHGPQRPNYAKWNRWDSESYLLSDRSRLLQINLTFVSPFVPAGYRKQRRRGAERKPRAAVRAKDPRFRTVETRRWGEAEYQGRAAVVIKPVSADSLRKTGIFPDKAGDFRRFLP